MRKFVLSVTALCMFGCSDTAVETYDLVVVGARIVDPESGTDAILNIGVSGGTIVELSSSEMRGDIEIDATGKIAIPGFIDVHTHSPFPYGESLQVADGVSTSLDLEAGAFPPSAYGEFIEGQARINYGASVGHYAARIKVIEGKDQPYLATREGSLVPGTAFTQQATTEQIEEIRKLLHQGIDEGGIGIGLLLDYMSAAVNHEELRMIFEVAAERNVVVWAHVRRGVNGDIEGLNEVLKLSLELGSPVHICHINANAMGQIGEWLAAIDDANANGADVSVEMFPYTAGSTSISADVFDRDWQTIFGISYEDVQWSETGEWFTKESWEEKRRTRPESNVIHHYMKEDWLKLALQHPEMMISSDATPAVDPEVKANPNVSGSFSRVFARYVRDEPLLTLNEAVAKTSYLPAKRLESFAPVFEKKGRLSVGADADILVFELGNIEDNATYVDPNQKSTGWDYVIVNGEVVISAGEETGRRPGRRMLAN